MMRFSIFSNINWPFDFPPLQVVCSRFSPIFLLDFGIIFTIVSDFSIYSQY